MSVQRLLPVDRAPYALEGGAGGRHAAAVKAGARVYLSGMSLVCRWHGDRAR